jgi:hypothetical protein
MSPRRRSLEYIIVNSSEVTNNALLRLSIAIVRQHVCEVDIARLLFRPPHCVFEIGI